MPRKNADKNSGVVERDRRRLLPDGTLVESKLLALQDVTVDTAALAWTRGNNGVQTTGLELTLNGGLDLAGSLGALLLLLLDGLALLDLLGLSFLLASATQRLAVVGLVPLTERSSVDLDDGRLGEGVGSDQLVVGRVEGDGNHTDFAGDALAAPGEVAGVETQTAEFAVAATGADEVDTLGADTGVGGLAALLESSVALIIRRCVLATGGIETIGLCIPLLAIVCALSTRGAALVTAVTRDTAGVSA